MWGLYGQVFIVNAHANLEPYSVTKSLGRPSTSPIDANVFIGKGDLDGVLETANLV